MLWTRSSLHTWGMMESGLNQCLFKGHSPGPFRHHSNASFCQNAMKLCFQHCLYKYLIIYATKKGHVLLVT
jgi:hypothetical protein